MTKFSDDGLQYWDGGQWLSAVSADGSWRWTGTEWVANRPVIRSRWPRIFTIGSWVLAGLAIILVLFSLVGVVAFVGEQSRGDTSALGGLGAVLVFISVAVLLATPIALRFAKRRGLLVAGSIAAACLFLGSCGGGVALVAAFPAPTPSAVARNPSSPGQTPSQRSVTPPIATVRPSPSSSPSPSPTHLPSPSPQPTPTPVAIASLPPAPAPPPAADTCGAPSNPWGYNFCGRGGYITSPAADFCTYFAPCVSTFWTATRGYVVQCVSGKWSHSGGVSGSCSSNGGVSRILYSGP